MVYKVKLSERALKDINQTVEYLLRIWSIKEATAYLDKLDHLKKIISENPTIFQYQDRVNIIRKAILTKHNIVYYKINDKEKIVNIITIFNVFQDPDKLEL